MQYHVQTGDADTIEKAESSDQESFNTMDGLAPTHSDSGLLALSDQIESSMDFLEPAHSDGGLLAHSDQIESSRTNSF